MEMYNVVQPHRMNIVSKNWRNVYYIYCASLSTVLYCAFLHLFIINQVIYTEFSFILHGTP